MRTWVEGLLAILIVVVLGVALFVFRGETLGGEEAPPAQALTFDPEAAARGAVLAEAAGCLQCHTADGTPASGPTFKGLAGSSRPLQSGESVIADDAYLDESIVAPDTQVVSGFQAVMPDDFSDQLSEQDLGDLVEYIKSLAS